MEATRKRDVAKSLNHALTTQKDQGNFLKDEWIIDNRTSNHMTGNTKLFYEHRLASGWDRVSIADGSHKN